MKLYAAAPLHASSSSEHSNNYKALAGQYRKMLSSKSTELSQAHWKAITAKSSVSKN